MPLRIRTSASSLRFFTTRNRKRRSYLKKCADIFKDLDDITDPVGEEDKMLMRMRYFGLQRQRCHEKGNCIFRALSNNFWGTGEHYCFIWQAILYQLYDLQGLYSRYYEGDFEDYFHLVSNKNFWGDRIVAQAASDLVKIVIVVGEKTTCFHEILPVLGRYKRVVFLCATPTYIGDIYPFTEIPPNTMGVNNSLSVDLETMRKVSDSTTVLEFCKNIFSYLEDQMDPTFHLKRQPSRLHFFGFEIRSIKGDGNCLYRTISDQVMNNEEHHGPVRKAVRYQLEEKPCFYQSQVLGDYYEYCKNVSTDKVWGNFTALQVACDAFRAKFYVIGADNQICMLEFCPTIGPYKKVLHATTAKQHMDSIYRIGETPMETDSGLDYLTLLKDDD